MGGIQPSDIWIWDLGTLVVFLLGGLRIPAPPPNKQENLYDWVFLLVFMWHSWDSLSQ